MRSRCSTHSATAHQLGYPGSALRQQWPGLTRIGEARYEWDGWQGLGRAGAKTNTNRRIGAARPEKRKKRKKMNNLVKSYEKSGKSLRSEEKQLKIKRKRV